MPSRRVPCSVFVKLVAKVRFWEEQVGLGRTDVCGFQRKEEMAFGASVCDMWLGRRAIEQ